jgi:hypothetical protein
LWLEMGAWFKNLAEKFRARPGALPSDILANPAIGNGIVTSCQGPIQQGGN